MTVGYIKYIKDSTRTQPGPAVLQGRGGGGKKDHRSRNFDHMFPEEQQYGAMTSRDMGTRQCVRMQTGVGGDRTAHSSQCRSRLEEPVRYIDQGFDRARAVAANRAASTTT